MSIEDLKRHLHLMGCHASRLAGVCRDWDRSWEHDSDRHKAWHRSAEMVLTLLWNEYPQMWEASKDIPDDNHRERVRSLMVDLSQGDLQWTGYAGGKIDVDVLAGCIREGRLPDLYEFASYMDAARKSLIAMDAAEVQDENRQDELAKIEERLKGKSLQLFRFLKDRPGITYYDTLHEHVWKGDAVLDDSVTKAIRRLNDDLKNTCCKVEYNAKEQRAKLVIR